MSCPGIPLFTTTPAVCSRYVCKDKRTNPAALTCVGSKYVFAEHYIVNGVVTKNADGGYVPAITVCQMNIETEKISRVRNSSARYFGL